MHRFSLIHLLCSFLLCTQNVLGESKLWTPEITVNTIIAGRSEWIICDAKMEANSVMIMQKQGDTVAVVTVVSLDQVIFSPLVADMSYTTSQISATDTPYVNVSVVFTITSANKTHAGQYKCELGSRTVLYNLAVKGPPTNMTLDTLTTNEVTLKKLAEYDVANYPSSRDVYKLIINIDTPGAIELQVEPVSDPKANVTWYRKAEGEYQWTNVMHGPSITLERETETLQSTSFFISALNEYGSYNVTIDMIVQYPPRSPSVLTTDLYPLEGGNVASVCEFDAIPPVSLFYTKEDENTGQWHRVDSPDNFFRLNNVQLDRDVGRYQCVGINDHGVAKGNITVHGEPQSVETAVQNKYSTSADILFKVKCATNVMFDVTWFTREENGVEKKLSYTWQSNTPRNELPQIVREIRIEQLSPNTMYTLDVKVTNDYGSIDCDSFNFTTEDDGVTPPVYEAIAEDMEITTSFSNKLVCSALLLIAVYFSLLL